MRYIILAAILSVVFLAAFRGPSQFTVNGFVRDANSGDPIVNVVIKVKGTKIMTTSAQNGSFSITMPSEKGTLVFTMIGFSSREVAVKGDTKNLSVSLNANEAELDEVVVGYSTAKKTEVYGATNASPMIARGIASSPALKSRKDYHSYETKPRGTIPQDYNREGYDGIVENRFVTVKENPLSTFSIDVDAASYSNVRRMLNSGNLPPAGAVRIEEMVNYFKYEYPQPKNNDPFSINTEMADCPWNTKHKLVLVGLQGKKIETENLPASNLVFLIDVSGSMMDENKLPLVKKSMKLLVDQLREQDRVAVVVYAGAAGLALPSTSGADKMKIKDAIDKLEAGGSTAGGAGIKLAYKTAKEHFAAKGNNRVIICTDGDFNIGESSDASMEQLIEEERKSGVFLTVLGYGMGNYQDAKMQKLADKGNGNHAYIDNFNEARKVLVSEFGGTLFTIAKDVKLQIEFNPSKVKSYRLIGYENRMLNKEDFNNDKKDAGDLGSGHTVTALYEVIPAGVQNDFEESVDPLKYQTYSSPSNSSAELMTVKFRYKQPDGETSKLIVHPVLTSAMTIDKASENFRFATAVAEFGMVLRNSESKQSSSYDHAWKLAKNALGKDDEGYRSELLQLIKTAQSLKNHGEDLSNR